MEGNCAQLMIKKLLYAAMLLSVISCGKDNPGACCMNVKGTLDIVYKNAKGENLLDEVTPGHYSTDKMKLFYIKAGEKKFVYDYNKDVPGGLFIQKNDPARLGVLFNINDEADIIYKDKKRTVGESSAIVELNPAVVDTIKVNWESRPGSIMITKAWHKNKLVFDLEAKLNGLDNHLEGFIIQK